MFWSSDREKSAKRHFRGLYDEPFKNNNGLPLKFELTTYYIISCDKIILMRP